MPKLSYRYFGATSETPCIVVDSLLSTKRLDPCLQVLDCFFDPVTCLVAQLFCFVDCLFEGLSDAPNGGIDVVGFAHDTNRTTARTTVNMVSVLTY